MKVNKQQLIESLSRAILEQVSTEIRKIVREEIDIERKRLRKQLIEELTPQLRRRVVSETVERTSHPMSRQVVKKVAPKFDSSKYVDTGDSIINSIMEGIKLDDGFIDEGSHEAFERAANRQSPKPQKLQEQQGELWKPEEGEGYNFDPTTMDASKIDWSNFIDTEKPLKAVKDSVIG